MAGLFRIFKNKWITPPQEPTESFQGKTVIVTGATSGIGLEAAAKFAQLGARKVILAARDTAKGAAVKAQLEARPGIAKDQLEVWELDMGAFASVVAFAERAVTELDQLNVAVLNAGVHRARFEKSAHGWEQDLQVNTLSTALLGVLLLPKMKETRRATGGIPVLEFVNSGLHQSAVVGPEARKEKSVLEWFNRPENFSEGSQYKFSKVFLMYATNKLAEAVSSGEVIITSVCPGAVMTDLGRDHYFPGIQVVIFLARLLIMRTPSQGANTLVSGTAQGEKVHGRFWQQFVFPSAGTPFLTTNMLGSDKIQPVPPSVVGEENKALALRIWNEIVEVLERDVPEAREVTTAITADL